MLLELPLDLIDRHAGQFGDRLCRIAFGPPSAQPLRIAIRIDAVHRKLCGLCPRRDAALRKLEPYSVFQSLPTVARQELMVLRGENLATVFKNYAKDVFA